ncbi:MAG: hypothetical protein GVY13_06720 [Alphaproteobacteria bacterium]|nr:hypothetical protein [Alphaproteobacteria bacterium]
MVTQKREKILVPGFAVAVLLAAALAGCSARPAGELWPNAPVQYGEGWQPELTAVENLEEWDTVIDVRRERVDDRQLVVIENLNTDDDVIVYYIDTRGSYQVVPIAAGGTQPVAALPRHIMRVQ